MTTRRLGLKPGEAAGMTSAQYLRWLAKKRPPKPMVPITDAEIAAFAEKAGWNKPRAANDNGEVK